MDLSTIKPTERVIEIKHPATGKPLGVRVTIKSITDEKLKPLLRKFEMEKMQLERRGRSFSPADIEEHTNALLFASMTGWEWYKKDVTFKGEKPDFNSANVKAVFNELEWFRNQLAEEVADEQSFFTV